MTPTETKRKHSKTPWFLNDFEILNEAAPGLGKAVPIHTGRIQGTLSPVADDWDEAQANAEFIVRAVNAHEELLEAAKELRQCLNAIVRPGEYAEELERAKAAIAKAEGR